MRISTHAQNKAIRFLVSAFTFYLCLVSFYINIGQDMAPENYLLCLPPTIAALFLLQYATKNDLFSRHHLPHILVGIAWCVTFPLLYAWSYDTAWYISKIRIDFLCGTGIFLLLPRLVAGAHWLSDNLAGGGFVVMQRLAWGYYTTAGKQVYRLLNALAIPCIRLARKIPGINRLAIIRLEQY